MLAISAGLAVAAMVLVAQLMNATEVRAVLPRRVRALHWLMTITVLAALVSFGVHVFSSAQGPAASLALLPLVIHVQTVSLLEARQFVQCHLEPET